MSKHWRGFARGGGLLLHKVIHNFCLKSPTSEAYIKRAASGTARATPATNVNNFLESSMFKHILVPVDGSEPSNNALGTAISLAKDNGARIRLVHVLDQSSYLMAIDPSGGSAGQLFSALRDSAMRILEEGKAAAEAAGLKADHVLIEDLGARLGDAIADAAVQWGADLIVVGTHGRRGPSRLLLGSGAEQIIRLAPVHVLVAPARAKR
jgi:nucleotide-binding universal stress UspA family protein